jgi:hypothetical protein
MVIDISLNPKGIDEELVYMDHPEYIKNIRRGNTLLETYFYDSHSGKYEFEYVEIIRRGMMKFFDLHYETIEVREDRYKKTDHLDKNKLLARKTIFGPILRTFSKGKSIEVIKLIKANGENVQISYNKTNKAWILASKNVSLLARNRADLEFYYPVSNNGEMNRYSFAYIIGHCWFDILNRINDTSLINSLQEFLSNKTMIGEYVGNQKHQHLIRYMKHTILFYGIVENNSDKTCMYVLDSYNAFKKFKLDVVPYQKIGEFSNHKDLAEALDKLYVTIAESSIIDEEEGSVLYISQIDNKVKEVLVMAKLKTLEYRVYRKLREKLKNHVSGFDSTDSRRKINQFFEEVRIMLSNYTLPMPLSFYYKVAETAFAFVKRFPEKCTDLHSCYIDFLEIILGSIDTTVNLKSKAIKQDNIMTYDNLIKNEYLKEKTVEVVIYAPPLYLSDEFLKTVEKKFKTSVRNVFIENYLGFDSNVAIYHINMHNFLLSKDDKFVIFFGINEQECMKTVDLIKEKCKNPQFVSYNTNPTLTPFLMNENLPDLMKTYLANSLEYIEKCKKYKNSNFAIFEKFDNSNAEQYLSEFEKIISELSSKKDKIDIESIKKESFVTESNIIFQGWKDKGSKYKGNNFITVYEDHINPFSEHRETFLKDNTINAKTLTDKIEINELSVKVTDNKNTKVVSIERPIGSKDIVVLVPMTIPGTGKTYFVEQLKEMLNKTDIIFNKLSSDDIRLSVMNTTFKHLSKDEAFSASGQQATREFENELKRLFGLSSAAKRSLVYLDKNHPPNALSRVFETIRKKCEQIPYINDLSIKYVALLPDCGSFKISDKKLLPFSLSYFIQCYVRIRNRFNHQTLNGDNKNLICILGLFMGNFINFSLNEQNLILHYKFDKIIKLPFTEELSDKLPDDLVKAATIFFDSLSNQLPPLDNKALAFEKLINTYFPKSDQFKSTKDLVKETAYPIIKNLYVNCMPENNTLIPKLPKCIYLGLLINNSKKLIYDTVNTALKAIAKNIKNDKVYNDISNIIKWIEKDELYKCAKGEYDWSLPHKEKVWHITTYFKGNSGEDKTNPAVIEFKQGKPCSIEISGLVYIPNKIITLFCKTDAAVNNFIPHITFLHNEYPPKASNDVLTALFAKEGVLEEKYKSNFNNKAGIDITEVYLGDYADECYVYKYSPNVKVRGEMNAFE